MKTIPLAVAGAFHTPLMQPAVEKLAAALAGVKLSPPRIPVISATSMPPSTATPKKSAPSSSSNSSHLSAGKIRSATCSTRATTRTGKLGPGECCEDC